MCFTSLFLQEDPKTIDTKVLPVSRKKVCPVSSQTLNESRRLWQKVTNSLKADDIEAATSAKHAVSGALLILMLSPGASCSKQGWR